MSTVPNEPADVFCWLYDRIEASLTQGACTSRLLESERRRCRPGESHFEWVRRVRLDSETLGTVPLHEDGFDLVRAIATMTGIHQALESLGNDTRGTVLPEGLSGLQARLIDTGRLNKHTDGALLFRRPRPAGPAASASPLADLFPCLLRVTRDQWAKLGVAVPEFGHLCTRIAKPGQIRVASLPWFTDPSDLTLGRVDDSVDLYSVWPSETLDREARTRDGLEALEASDAVLGLVPESTLDPATVEAWRSACIATASEYRGKLAWIVIGSGLLSLKVEASDLFPGESASAPLVGETATRITNQAVVMDRRTGEIILIQDKHPGFTVTPDIVQKYGQSAVLGDDEGFPEWIESSTRLWALELPIGRIVILVCEALKRVTSNGARAAALSPDIILSPLFAMKIAENTWAHVSAKILSSELGASVAVFNSKGLRRRDAYTVSTMLTVTPQECADTYLDSQWEFTPKEGEEETLDCRTDAVTTRVGVIGI